MLFSALAAAPSTAQEPARPATHVISGFVFDSVGRVPLARAVVQIAQVDSAASADARPRIYWGVADSAGHYQIDGVPSGRFAIGFQHSALESLGIDSPLQAFELTSQTGLTIDLAIPSGRALAAQLCGNVARDGHDGMLIGHVSDARGQNALSGAVVLVHWLEVALDKGDFHTVPHRSTAPADGQGRYVACGIASEAPVSVQVSLAGHRTLTGVVSVPDGSVRQQDFRLPDSADTKGSATLVGRVVHTDGSPVSTGKVSLADLALEAPIRNGEFTLRELPPGTWEVEALAIGYEPMAALVEVAEHGTAATTITIAKRARMLDAVTVIGRPSGDLKVLDDIARRGRSSFGNVFTAGHWAVMSAMYPADILREARGFTYISTDSVIARGCRHNFSRKQLVIYLDGMRFQSGLEELKNAVPIKDLLAMETFPDVTTAPVQWRTNDACAVIAVWTKR